MAGSRYQRLYQRVGELCLTKCKKYWPEDVYLPTTTKLGPDGLNLNESDIVSLIRTIQTAANKDPLIVPDGARVEIPGLEAAALQSKTIIALINYVTKTVAEALGIKKPKKKTGGK